MWVQVAEGPIEDIEYVDTGDLPHGTKVRFEVETAPGAAYLADIWGDEWVINRFATEGVTITNSYSVDSRHVLCEGFVNSPSVGLILGIIAAVVAIAGIAYIIYKVSMWVDQGVIPPLDEIFSARNIAVAAGVGLAGTIAFFALREVAR